MEIPILFNVKTPQSIHTSKMTYALYDQPSMAGEYFWKELYKSPKYIIQTYKDILPKDIFKYRFWDANKYPYRIIKRVHKLDLHREIAGSISERGIFRALRDITAFEAENNGKRTSSYHYCSFSNCDDFMDFSFHDSDIHELERQRDTIKYKREHHEYIQRIRFTFSSHVYLHYYLKNDFMIVPPPTRVKEGDFWIRSGYGSLDKKITSLPDYFAMRISVENNFNLNNVNIYVTECKYGIHKVSTEIGEYESRYLRKTIMFSQTDENIQEYFFFGLYVYEFEGDGGLPRNEGRVYISYLDSNPYYTKGESGYNLGFVILNAYLEYASALGFNKAYIWSCAPNTDGNGRYIFKNAPVQNALNDDKLKIWYENMLKKGCNRKYMKGGKSWDYKYVHRKLDGSDYDLPLFPGDIKGLQISGGKGSGHTFEIELGKCVYFNRYYEKIQEYEIKESDRSLFYHLYDFSSLEMAIYSTQNFLNDLYDYFEQNHDKTLMTNSNIKLFETKERSIDFLILLLKTENKKRSQHSSI